MIAPKNVSPELKLIDEIFQLAKEHASNPENYFEPTCGGRNLFAEEICGHIMIYKEKHGHCVSTD